MLQEQKIQQIYHQHKENHWYLKRDKIVRKKWNLCRDKLINKMKILLAYSSKLKRDQRKEINRHLIQLWEMKINLWVK